MKLASFGCSYIFGTDLADSLDSSRRSMSTWPALLAQQRGMEYKCYAGGGRGNLMIFDRLINTVLRNPDWFFVIQWTYIDRFDYSDPNGWHFNGDNKNDYLSLLPGNQDVKSSYYFRNLHSEYKDKFTSLTYIKTALDVLIGNKCRFIMTCIDDLLWCDQYNISPVMKDWQEYIQPHISTFEGENFLKWSQQKNFPISSTGHPLEAAHKTAADLMQPIIDNILYPGKDKI